MRPRYVSQFVSGGLRRTLDFQPFLYVNFPHPYPKTKSLGMTCHDVK
ncbi:hypothetical protein J2797_006667 [Paraburkholderia terricola]|jgi:hypothetical protein|nr:hypothetical protein [Paraburkholderia terricola]